MPYIYFFVFIPYNLFTISLICSSQSARVASSELGTDSKITWFSTSRPQYSKMPMSEVRIKALPMPLAAYWACDFPCVLIIMAFLPLSKIEHLSSQLVHCCWAAIEVVIAAQMITIAAASIGDAR